MFVDKTEHDIYNYFALEKLYFANMQMMVDEYILTKFGIKVDQSARAYSTDKCPIWRVKAEAIEAADEYTTPEKKDIPRKEWARYKNMSIAIPNETTAALNEVEKFLKHPLLPNECSIALQKLKDAVDQKIATLGTALEIAAQKMEEAVPNKETLDKFQTGWIHYIWNSNHISLETPVSELIEFTRAYFASDQFFSGSKKGFSFKVWKGRQNPNSKIRKTNN
ncbi:hypothetical protein [Saccharothrix sp. Mg75]|uniref:hypothetical protein n=1 Tax=Saccharothrix sp. Mg75 TaxID=3445357 RepID=UPI003EEA679B